MYKAIFQWAHHKKPSCLWASKTTTGLQQDNHFWFFFYQTTCLLRPSMSSSKVTSFKNPDSSKVPEHFSPEVLMFQDHLWAATLHQGAGPCVSLDLGLHWKPTRLHYTQINVSLEIGEGGSMEARTDSPCKEQNRVMCKGGDDRNA